MSLEPEGLSPSMIQKRDWRRPVNWGVAAFLFLSIMTQTPGVDLFDTFGILLVSLTFGFTFSVLFAAIGAVRTLFTPRPSGILIPFYTLSNGRSFQAIVLWIVGMLLKITMIFLGAIGVIATLIVGFAVLQRLWPDQAAVKVTEN